MSGHSKWHNIKAKKSKMDAQRGKIFTKLTRELVIAAREGGPNPDTNLRLRVAIDKARAANMPKDNIDKAIAKGAGNLEGQEFVEALYEGYGPGGVAILVEVTTDNKNRTAADVRRIFSRHGGTLAESGAVSWQFERKGVIELNKEQVPSIDELTLELIDFGVDDVLEEDDSVTIYTQPDALSKVLDYLNEVGIEVSRAELEFIPKNYISVSEEEGRKILSMLEELDDNDDVQEVYTNADLPEVLTAEE
ncbi:MAG: YebC/PmpR family DNA-binding transcriptional regulator [Coprothermobacter sp.]|uniref:YebC/PmpR family DNA-binding transcriptional regulator n=1 Tax=Coprothermobacter proteolyticus TaxID=35786 RepID=UPI000D302B89|nr:YebC/PmpR family DNA-binding transcriptional regulator [Coprothermobacter proteolyticus]MBP8983868.1 YebC/PmpR family DNA-binding transcriptional regulator [Coprothermobacter sp.]